MVRDWQTSEYCQTFIPHIEDGTHRLDKGHVECVQVLGAHRVVKGQVPGVVVQQDADSSQMG